MFLPGIHGPHKPEDASCPLHVSIPHVPCQQLSRPRQAMLHPFCHSLRSPSLYFDHLTLRRVTLRSCASPPSTSSTTLTRDCNSRPVPASGPSPTPLLSDANVSQPLRSCVSPSLEYSPFLGQTSTSPCPPLPGSNPNPNRTRSLFPFWPLVFSPLSSRLPPPLVTAACKQSRGKEHPRQVDVHGELRGEPQDNRPKRLLTRRSCRAKCRKTFAAEDTRAAAENLGLLLLSVKGVGGVLISKSGGGNASAKSSAVVLLWPLQLFLRPWHDGTSQRSQGRPTYMARYSCPANKSIALLTNWPCVMCPCVTRRLSPSLFSCFTIHRSTLVN